MLAIKVANNTEEASRRCVIQKAIRRLGQLDNLATELCEQLCYVLGQLTHVLLIKAHLDNGAFLIAHLRQRHMCRRIHITLRGHLDGQVVIPCATSRGSSTSCTVVSPRWVRWRRSHSGMQRDSVTILR